MNCRDFLNCMDGFLADRLEADEERDFRGHLRSCSSCREAAVTADPVLVLSAAPLKEPSDRQVEACVGAVAALIRQDRLQRRISRPKWRWMAAAAAVVVSTGAGVTWWANRPEAGGAGAALATNSVSAVSGRENPPPPHVEVEAPGNDLRVYQYADAGDGNTTVVYIVNESLEL